MIEDPLLGSDILSILQGEADSLTSEAPASKAVDTVEPTVEAKPKKTAAKAASKRNSATPKKPTSIAKAKRTVKTKAEATSKKAAQKTSPSSGKRKSPTSKKSASAPKNAKTVEHKAETTSKKAAQKVSSPKSSTLKKIASQSKTNKSQKKASRSSSSSLKMIKPYDQMNKTKAIAQILQENPGKVMHTDDLSLILFGKLTPEQHQAERARMKTTMYQDVDQNRWNKVPKKKMCYVYDPSANVGPTNSDTPKG